MARLESKVDMMHVPTPLEVLARVRAAVDIPPGLRAVDPCCGDGTALLALNPHGVNYGIELDAHRARLASAGLAHVLHSSMQDARVSNCSFGLCLLNPPYDASTEGRLESVFLDRCTRYLAPGGVLVLIIKESMYDVVAKRLMRDYEPIGHWRFPAPYFDGPELAFGQTVLIARKLLAPSSLTDPVAYMQHALGIGSLEAMPTADELMAGPRAKVPIGQDPLIFLGGAMSSEDLARLLETSPLAKKEMALPPRLSCGRPPLPLKRGHISLLLASGLVNGVYGDGPTLHVAKGTVVRQTDHAWQEDSTASGNLAMLKTTTDSFAIKIRALRPDGSIRDLEVMCKREEAA